jgi:hypothetical protein
MPTSKPQPPQKPDTSTDSAWHLDKKVNISHIIATLMLAAAIFTWGSKIEQRIALVEASSTRQAQVDQAQDQEFRRYASRCARTSTT